MVQLIGYSKCSTCKKAQDYLDAKGLDYTFREIKTENPTEAELAAWHTTSGLPLKRFFNTSGLVYKALALKDKLPTMTEAEQYAVLATDGMLVKRPILITEKGICPGFKAAVWDELLG